MEFIFTPLQTLFQVSILIGRRSDGGALESWSPRFFQPSTPRPLPMVPIPRQGRRLLIISLNLIHPQLHLLIFPHSHHPFHPRHFCVVSPFYHLPAPPTLSRSDPLPSPSPSPSSIGPILEAFSASLGIVPFRIMPFLLPYCFCVYSVSV